MATLATKLAGAAFAALLLHGCGGGGGGGGGGGDGGGGGGTTPPPTTTPFGLTSRPPAAALNFPDTTTVGNVALNQVATGFSLPLFFTSIPGTSYSALVEQGGTIKVLDSNFVTVGTLLDISSLVHLEEERGLLGLAFDPDYATNGYFYVDYVSDKINGRCTQATVSDFGGCTRISRFKRTNSSGVPSALLNTEKVLMEVVQPAENHKGGMLAFGQDNNLYISMGDGGSNHSQNAQDRTTLLGKILRIKPNNLDDNPPLYTIPPTNPFVGNSSGWREEIWAYGFRNPWRFSFAPDGKLWAGDVGQFRREEIDIVTAGGNYGWDFREGTEFYSGATSPVVSSIDPVWDYGRTEGLAVTGGYVYRGSAMPTSWHQKYIYGDYGSAQIWALDTSTFNNETVASLSNRYIRSFGEDSSGELYVATVEYPVPSDTSITIGRLYRIAPGGSGGTVPAHLSETGLFGSNTASLVPVTGLIEYDVNTQLWSDGTVKRRWISLPAGGRITFSATGSWQLPVGSVIVKHFAIALDQRQPAALHNLETRVLVHETSGWFGYTYRWNTQTDADLVTSTDTETLNRINESGSPFSQTYEYPNSAQCNQCHTSVAGTLLGLRTRQLNRNFTYANGVTDNQLRSLNNIQLFTTAIGAATQYDTSAALNNNAVSIAQRARDYLDTNCSQCHQPGGPTDVNFDLRASPTLAQMNIVNVNPIHGNLGVSNAKILVEGDKTKSLLWERMRRTDTTRMPPLATHVVDQAAVDLIGQWIDSL